MLAPITSALRKSYLGIRLLVVVGLALTVASPAVLAEGTSTVDAPTLNATLLGTPEPGKALEVQRVVLVVVVGVTE